MKNSIMACACVALSFATGAAQAQQAAGGRPAGCQRLTKPYMSTTSDLGATFTSFRLPRQGSITWGLAAIDDQGALVMQAGDSIWGSENDGCTWRLIRSVDATGIFRVAAASGGVAYAWQDNGGKIIRVTHAGGRGQAWSAVSIKGPTSSMHGFGVDGADPMHVRTAGNDGQMYQSFDGGTSWRAIGVAAMPGGFLGYVMAFDPNDLDHAVYGRVVDGGFVTFDGGQTWTQSTGLASVEGGRVNLFNAVISPVDCTVVFAMGIDLQESSDNVPSRGKHIYASVDGGLSFTVVIDHRSDGVLLQNGPVMQADGRDAGVLLFLSSVSPVFGGTTFYQYNLDAGTLGSVHNDFIPKIRVIEPSRVQPGAIHVGFDFF